MLDLGFLEDVEKILALTPNSRQTALFSATMPPPIRKLADRYLYDPVHVKVQGRDADRRLGRAVPASTVEDRRQGRQARRGARGRAPDQAIVFARTKIRTRPALPQAARPRHQRQGAARRHVAGLARRRDARLQGRPRADPRRDRRRRARPRHLDRHARRQLRRPDLARTSTCTASAAPAASGARAARSRSSSRARSASSRRSRSTSAPRSRPWSAGRARSRRRRSTERPRRHDKPQIKRNGDGRGASCIVSAGRADGHRARRSRPRRHRRRRAWTARRCATCACSSASRSWRFRRASSRRFSSVSTACAPGTPCCAWSPSEP